MLNAVKTYWIYILSFLFIVLNGVFTAYEQYYFALIPFVLAIVFMAFFALDKLMLFVVFATPFSINLQDLNVAGDTIGIALPTEPLMFGIMLLFLFKLLFTGKFDKRITYHPVTLAIILNLFWIFITCFTSELPKVSFKFFIARLWFVITFYFVATQLFRERRNIRRFLWLYITSLTVVIIYTVIRHSMYGFEEQPAHWVMEPFFNDHTSYGALMAMFYPILFFLMNKKVSSTNTRIFLIVLIAIFSLGLILSYTRAAWVSLLAALIVYFLYKFKIKLGVILTLSAAVILTIVFSWSKIMMKLEKNNQDSSDELAEHVKSISNISTDASNLERINRWKSALRMFKERPVFGFGPGTYSFVYAPYQLSSEKTIISTNAGDMGNAHSEYIGPLSESGALGLLTFLLIVLTIYWQASKLYHSLDESTLKSLVLAIIVGFTTYAVHGLLNNYLDTDKASVPFWGFAAMLVAIEVYKDELTFDTKSQ
ncbi:MAG: hypothetical protein Kow0079_05020 [Vicingaceae bacterium]